MRGRLRFGRLHRRAALSFARTFERCIEWLARAFARRGGSIVALIFVAAGRSRSTSPTVVPAAAVDHFGGRIQL